MGTFEEFKAMHALGDIIQDYLLIKNCVVLLQIFTWKEFTFVFTRVSQLRLFFDSSFFCNFIVVGKFLSVKLKCLTKASQFRSHDSEQTHTYLEFRTSVINATTIIYITGAIGHFRVGLVWPLHHCPPCIPFLSLVK